MGLGAGPEREASEAREAPALLWGGGSCPSGRDLWIDNTRKYPCHHFLSFGSGSAGSGFVKVTPAGFEQSMTVLVDCPLPQVSTCQSQRHL